MKISRAQVLHVIAALVIVPLAGVVSAWLAKHFPGLPASLRSKEAIEHEALLVTAAAFAFAFHYLRGFQLWERAEAEGIIKVEGEEGEPTTEPPLSADPPSVEGGAPGEV